MIFAEVASRVGLLGKVNLPRESRAGEGWDGGEREKGWEKGRLCTAVGVCTWRKVVELKLRRCLSPFVPNLHSLEGIEGRRRFSPFLRSSRRSEYATSRAPQFSTLGLGFWKMCEVAYDEEAFSSQLVSYLTTSIERRAHLPTGGVGVLAA